MFSHTMQRSQVQNSDAAMDLSLTVLTGENDNLPDSKLLRDAVVELTQLPPFGSKFYLHVAR